MVKLNPKSKASITRVGGGERLFSPSQDVTVKVSGENSEFTSTFEVVVPPGFDTGAHFHTRTEELFYLIEGSLLFMAFSPVEQTNDWFNWVGENGEKPILCHAGFCIHVPNQIPHAFANLSSMPAKMIFQASPPPDHEDYFRGLIDIFNQSEVIDSVQVDSLRKKHDVHQITQLTMRPIKESLIDE